MITIKVNEMAEKEEKKKRIHGFAGTLAKQMAPLNDNEKFKHIFKDTAVKVLINATDGKYAALIAIDKGVLTVSDVKNSPKENISKKAVGWDGRIMMSTSLFMDMGMGKLSTGGAVKKVLTRKIKIKGVKNVLLLLKIFDLGDEEAESSS